jgi:hypothetical protein
VLNLLLHLFHDMWMLLLRKVFFLFYFTRELLLTKWVEQNRKVVEKYPVWELSFSVLTRVLDFLWLLVTSFLQIHHFQEISQPDQIKASKLPLVKIYYLLCDYDYNKRPSIFSFPLAVKYTTVLDSCGVQKYCWLGVLWLGLYLTYLWKQHLRICRLPFYHL